MCECVLRINIFIYAYSFVISYLTPDKEKHATHVLYFVTFKKNIYYAIKSYNFLYECWYMVVKTQKSQGYATNNRCLISFKDTNYYYFFF